MGYYIYGSEDSVLFGYQFFPNGTIDSMESQINFQKAFGGY